MKDPAMLSEDVYEIPAPFEGEQTLSFEDYDIRDKEYGFWLQLQFRATSGEKATWSGNFYKSPDPKQKQAHNISWGGLKDFFKAAGVDELPASSQKAIAEKLNSLVSVTGNPIHVKALVRPDDKGYANAGRFKAA